MSSVFNLTVAGGGADGGADGEDGVGCRVVGAEAEIKPDLIFAAS